MSEWSGVGAQLAQLGLPVLGRVLGGHIPIIGPLVGAGLGEQVGTIAATAIAKALGVQATPQAVATAIETQGTTEVVSTLKAVEAEAVAKWPALAEISKQESMSEVEGAKINAESYAIRRQADTASDVATNNFWMTLYRPVAMGGCTFFLLYLVGIILWTATFGGPMVDSIARMETILMTVFATLVGILFGHFVTTAAVRRKALDSAAEPVQPTIVSPTVEVKK